VPKVPFNPPTLQPEPPNPYRFWTPLDLRGGWYVSVCVCVWSGSAWDIVQD